MKTLAKIAMIVLMGTGAWVMPQKAAAQYPGVTFQVFYDQLSPYGAWVYDDQYGYVWIPDESAGFYPYGTNGHWVFTVYGWTWVSYYQWGWAPFHYGRWNWDPYYGWIWVPGNEWGPAWVSWRRCNDYYGWAPLGPGITVQMSFNMNFYMSEDRWMFVRHRDFDRPDLDRHFAGRRENHDLFRESRTIENSRTDNNSRVTYLTGPDAKEVKKYTGRDIKPLPVTNNSKPGTTIVNKGQVEIYRPPVKREDVTGQKPAPVRILTKETIRPVSERTKGDLTKVNTNTDQTKVKEQVQPPSHTVPPKYDRNDQVNQKTNTKVNQVDQGTTGSGHSTGTVNSQKNQGSDRTVNPPADNNKVNPSNQNRMQQPPPETRTHEQSGQKQNNQPPVETRKEQPAGQKQIGAPVQQKQPAPQTGKANSNNNKSENVNKTSSPPPKSSQSSEPQKRGH